MKAELYDLLPALYRNRDYYNGGQLQALVQVMADEIDVMRQDIDRLYDNWFIETCDEWVTTYIGDLLAATGLYPGKNGVFSLRAYVANTLAYRRRKGTASVLENIVQDVSGWSASVTEFFQFLTTSQHLSHVRMTTTWTTEDTDEERIGSVGTMDISKERLTASLGTAFDTTSRTIDIRPFTQHHGWHHVDHIGIFLWRLRSYPMERRRATPLLTADPDGVSNQFFTFHPLGLSAPLFTNPTRQSGATSRRREWEVPQAIDHDAFLADPARWYGENRSLMVFENDEGISVESIAAISMETWPPSMDLSKDVNIDVERGLLAFKSPETSRDVWVSYHYGFSASIGGGPYDRAMASVRDGREVYYLTKAPIHESGDDRVTFSSLKECLEVISCSGDTGPSPRSVLIRIMDSATYHEDSLHICMDPGDELIIEAAEGASPTIDLRAGQDLYWKSECQENLDFDPCGSQSGVPHARLHLNGLQIAGTMFLKGAMKVDIEHCTILPLDLTWFAIEVSDMESSTRMEISISSSVLGSLGVQPTIRHITIKDSLIDGLLNTSAGDGDPLDRSDVIAIQGVNEVPLDPAFAGPALIVERSTIFGGVLARAMPLASESIFAGQVVVEERQGGCMRYCYVAALDDDISGNPQASRTPRRFRCQPDLALEGVSDPVEADLIRSRIEPVFSSERYGDPNYTHLSWRCPDEIRTGGENGTEMGVFNHLMEPQREANLREAVRRYLPFGLEMNIIYADEEN